MAKNVIIIEAHGKVKNYEKYAGSKYKVIASGGHCVDLPVKKLGINIKKDFEPTWEVLEDNKSIVSLLKKECKNADFVYLATDNDREGSGIAKNIYDLIKDSCKGKIYRCSTNQITKAGITQALENPGEIDEDQVNAYIARRLLDRICGYKTSYLTYQTTGGRSAGRVQSAVLRIIVDREKEIIHFVPEEYWLLTAYLLSSKGEQYTATLTDKIKVPNEKKATQIYDECMKSTPVIKSVESKDVNISPYAPFTTLPMVFTAGSILGWSADKVMSIAQDLYSCGASTYHRTDSPTIAPEALNSIREYIQKTYDTAYLPSAPNIYKAKAGAQEAHEACRPTDINALNPGLTGDHEKLYRLIWKRTVASQMMSARDRRLKVITKIGKYDFVSTGKTELFDGFRKCWNYSSSADIILPNLKKGEKCLLKQLTKEQKFTSPPPRYTDASLAKFCEKKQITRPATVANVFKTLKDRNYVTKKKNTFHPTETGIHVVDFLVEADFCFIDIEFTKCMEDLLDDIQEGKKDKVAVLSEFWERLKKDIENGKKIKNEKQISEYKCPKCESNLLLKHSKYGAFYACSRYKIDKDKKNTGCDYIANVGENGEPIEKVKKEKKYLDFKCKKCGGKMLERQSKFGSFAGCENYNKGCKSVADLEGNFKTQSGKKKWKKK